MLSRKLFVFQPFWSMNKSWSHMIVSIRWCVSVWCLVVLNIGVDLLWWLCCVDVRCDHKFTVISSWCSLWRVLGIYDKARMVCFHCGVGGCLLRPFSSGNCWADLLEASLFPRAFGCRCTRC
jgi:hypothetical protein